MNENELPRKRHALSALCPDMSADVYAAMLADMAAAGYDEDEPVIIFEDKVLDGWHRFTAGHSLGIPVPEKPFAGTLEDAKAFVKRKLLHRDMTPSQRAQVVVDINGWRPAGVPVARNVAPGATLKSNEELAAEAGVSPRTIRQAKQVARDAIPEVHKKVLDGDLSVKAGAEIAAKPRSEQKKAMNAPAERKTGASKWKPAEVPKPQVGASLDALRDRDERISVLAEEVDRLTDRVAVLAAGGQPTEEERRQYAATVEDLRAQVKAMEAELDAVKASRDHFQAENHELIAQCRMYRNQLQKQPRAA